jgi:hypothetical protein
VAVLHIKQVRHLNLYFLELDKCREQKDSLLSIVYDFHALTLSQANTINKQGEQILTLNDIIATNGVILTNTKKELSKEKNKRTYILLAAFALGAIIIAQ